MLQRAYVVSTTGSKKACRRYKEGDPGLERRGVVWAGAIFFLVGLAYVVPYVVLSGVDRWYGSFLFWALFGGAAILVNVLATRGWRD
jgi:cytochrome c oxidase subunit IV